MLNVHGQLELGENSHLGAFCHVNVCYGKISIGNHVAIGPHCSLIAYSNNYGPDQLCTDLRLQEDIRIGDNVFIGAHCTVLPGTVIEDNVVVGAGSVVKGTLESGHVYAGAVCRKIKTI